MTAGDHGVENGGRPSRSRSRRRPRSLVGTAASRCCLLLAAATSGLGVTMGVAAAAAAEDDAADAVTSTSDASAPRNLRWRVDMPGDDPPEEEDESLLPPLEDDDHLFLGPNEPSLRIIGGMPAALNSQPYMASLKRYSPYDRSGQHFCGATLVAPNVLLSAAHCHGGWEWAEVGRYDLSDRFELSPRGSRTGIQAVKVAKARELKHPGFKGRGLVTDNGNDFMLIRIADSVPERIQPVMLDLQLYETRHELVDGDALLVSGWGVYKNRYNSATGKWEKVPSSTLLDATVFYVNEKTCRASRGLGYSYWNAIDETMMCAKAPKRDACQGDSGGPLILHPDSNKWSGYGQRSRQDVPGDEKLHIQTGIVSFGIGCANRYFPGVYSRISSQAKWIRDNVCAMTREGGVAAPWWFNCDGELDRNADGTGGGGSDAGPEAVPSSASPTATPTSSPTRAPVKKTSKKKRRRKKGRRNYKGPVDYDGSNTTQDDGQVAVESDGDDWDNSEIEPSETGLTEEEELLFEGAFAPAPADELLENNGEGEGDGNGAEGGEGESHSQGEHVVQYAKQHLLARDNRHPLNWARSKYRTSPLKVPGSETEEEGGSGSSG